MVTTKPKEIPRRYHILTKELVDTVCNNIKAGMTFQCAYAFSGVTKSNFEYWNKKGQEEFEQGLSSLYAYAYQELEMAKLHALGVAQTRVYNGIGEWQSSARWLEANEKANWSKRQLELTGSGDKGEVVLKVVYDDKRSDNTPASTTP